VKGGGGGREGGRRLTGSGIVKAAVHVEDRPGRATVYGGKSVVKAGLRQDPLE
jgi:hypothetical protein